MAVTCKAAAAAFVTGTYVASSVLATGRKPVGVAAFIAVSEILGVVEEFTTLILINGATCKSCQI